MPYKNMRAFGSTLAKPRMLFTSLKVLLGGLPISGSEVNSVSITTNTCTATPGKKLFCRQGRSCSRIDQLTFTPTGPR